MATSQTRRELIREALFVIYYISTPNLSPEDNRWDKLMEEQVGFLTTCKTASSGLIRARFSSSK